MKHLATNICQFSNFFPSLKNIISINFKKLISINFYLLISINFHNVYAQETESLNQYLQIAGENNPHLKSLFNQYLAALEEVPQVGTLPDPQVSFAVFIQPIETRVGAQRASFSASQMFPWFGTLTAQEQVAAERAKAQLQQFEDAKLGPVQASESELQRSLLSAKGDADYASKPGATGFFQRVGAGQF